ncbi:MAG: hypothetical protein Q8P62_03315 [Candidatus Peregrinibacteria bacterium]|nr:hypothetical protein [Candidatus Peregrinibacteria bacterium]
MGMEFADREVEEFGFSEEDIGLPIYINGEEGFKISHVFSSGEIEVTPAERYLFLAEGQGFNIMRGVEKDELYAVFRFDNGKSLKVEIKGFDVNGKKLLEASILSSDFQVQN